MPSPSTRTLAAAGVLVGIATGVVTNLITSRWSWSLGAALVVLVAAAVHIAVRSTSSGPQGGSTVRVRVTRGGRIVRSGTSTRDGANVRVEAVRTGSIIDSPTAAHGTSVDQRVDRGGEITDSPITAD